MDCSGEAMLRCGYYGCLLMEAACYSLRSWLRCSGQPVLGCCCSRCLLMEATRCSHSSWLCAVAGLWVPAEMGSMRQPLDLAVLWWRARVEMLLPSELAEVGSMLLP